MQSELQGTTTATENDQQVERCRDLHQKNWMAMGGLEVGVPQGAGGKYQQTIDELSKK